MSYENENWIPVSDAAQSVGKTRRQILYMVEKERLEALKFGGRWFVSRDDLQAQCFGHRSGSCGAFDRSDRNQADFLEVDMGRIVDPPPSRDDESRKTLEAMSSIDSAMRVHISRKDGTSLAMIIPEVDGRIAEHVIRMFLGG